ncbi:hypothetical protein BGW39_004168 [Mortierella sp. 14UC]|nr:hypothetical protein BGW39_004168 [Mortierella sp. 14UC]
MPTEPTIWERVLLMPELAYALQCFLDRPHLAVASRVCQTWHQVWTPFLWKHLLLKRPRPAAPLSNWSFLSAAARRSLEASTNRNYNDDDQDPIAYALSSTNLGHFGHFVMRLDATWLTTPELLRISSYCVQLRALKLSDCPLPAKTLSALLQSLTRLSRLSLDIPMHDYSQEEEGDKDAGTAAVAEHKEQDERTRGRIFHRDELGENETLKVVEIYGSSETLEYLELAFQSSVRISVKAICSLLRRQRSLRTFKLVDVDIEDPVPRGSKKKKKKKDRGQGPDQGQDDRRKGRNRRSNRNHGSSSSTSTAVASSASAASGLTASTASSTTSSSVTTSPTPSPTTPSISDTDNSGDGDTESPPEWQVTESFGLHFFSICSSHIPDSSLIHLLERCPYLRALHLHSCDSVTDQSLQAITTHNPHLESISLASCKQITTSGLDQFFHATVAPLIHVHLCDLASLHDKTLEILAGRHRHSLLKLAIYFCGFVTDRGVKALLTVCSQLRVFGLQAYGMTTAIFEHPWACSKTLEQLDLQGVFKLTPAPSEAATTTTPRRYSVTALWQDRQARIDGFAVARSRLITLERLKNLRLAAGEIGKEVLGGFLPTQRIEILHLYGLQSSLVDRLPWSDIRTSYPYLRQVYCGVTGVIGTNFKDELKRLNVELLASSSIPDLAFENTFDD